MLGESVIRVDFNTGNLFFSAAMPLMGLGMILVGVAVFRGRTWSGWRRFAPLACGLYIPFVLIPSFVIAKGPSFIAITGLMVAYLMLGVAMRVEEQRA